MAGGEIYDVDFTFRVALQPDSHSLMLDHPAIHPFIRPFVAWVARSTVKCTLTRLCSRSNPPADIQYAALNAVHGYSTFLPGLVRAFLSNSHLL